MKKANWTASEAPGLARPAKGEERGEPELTGSSDRLIEAVRSGNLPRIRAAMREGGDPRAAGGNLLTPLGVAVRLDDAQALEAMLSFLREAGALGRRNDLRSTGDVGLMQEAARSKSLNAWRALAKAGFDPRAKDGQGWSAARWAKERGIREILRELGERLPADLEQASLTAPGPKSESVFEFFFGAPWTREKEEARNAQREANEQARLEREKSQKQEAPAAAGGEEPISFTRRLKNFFFGVPPAPVSSPDSGASAQAPQAQSQGWGINFGKALHGLEECGLSEEGMKKAARALEVARELSPRGRMPATGMDALELKRVWEVNIPLLLEAVLAVPEEHRATRGAGARRSALESVEQTLEGAIERMEAMRSHALARAQARIEGEMAVIEQNTARWGRGALGSQEAKDEDQTGEPPSSAPKAGP